jgi:hypothetical protein
MGKPRAFAACLTSQEMVVNEIRQLHLQIFLKALCASELHQLSRLIYPRECFWMDLVAGYLVTVWSYFPSFSAHRCTRGCTSKSSHSELVTQRIVHVVSPMLTLRKVQPRRYLLIEPEIPILLSDHDWLQLTLFSFVRTILNPKP